MSEQSTRHILMVEPVEFYANPETMDTNVYQVDPHKEPENELFQRALSEFRGLRDMLVENGVHVTTVHGVKGSPDSVFPNGISTHEEKRCFLYPMLNENRRAERRPGVIDLMRRMYSDVQDWTGYEVDGKALEATGSLVQDRVNKVVYAALSARTNEELVQKWANFMGYDLETFETKSHSGQPVYHTDLLLYIGSTMAGFCAESLVDEKRREQVLDRLRQTHEVLELSMEQLRSFCGNALEVAGEEGEKLLVMSSAAHEALTKDQHGMIADHFDKVVHSPLPTLEQYGGGSARCCLCELF